MMYPLKQKTIALLAGGLLVFSACKKDSDSDAGTAPVVEPLAVAAAKANDTITIKGQNFNATASGNVVKIGDVEATVVSASATEIKIVVPAIGTPGTYTITVTANGKTIEAGSIVIAPLTFYAVKGVFSTTTEYQVITINPQDGSESLVASVGQDRIGDVVYLPATNEIVGVNDLANKLIRVNVTTKQVTTKTLTSSTTVGIGNLVVDKDNNLYGIKYDFTTGRQLQSLIKIDPATGNSTVIKTFESNDGWYEPVYVAASNEVIGLKEEGTRLFKMNLTTKDTSSVYLPGSANKMEYRELVVDNKSNLSAYKARLHGDLTDMAQLVRLNTVTGQETVWADLPVDGKLHDKVIYVSQLNEFMGTWDQRSILRLNGASSKITFSPAPPLNGNTYNYLTTN